jgi:hypothetical protein
MASMKSVQYNVSSAITETELLAAECDCKAGCKNNGPSELGKHRVACTHSLAEAVQMSQLMFQGFAKWVLASLHSSPTQEGEW